MTRAEELIEQLVEVEVSKKDVSELNKSLASTFKKLASSAAGGIGPTKDTVCFSDSKSAQKFYKAAGAALQTQFKSIVGDKKVQFSSKYGTSYGYANGLLTGPAKGCGAHDDYSHYEVQFEPI